MRPELPTGFCYWNADEYAAKFDGEVLHGWLVTGWAGIYINLFHHAVVRLKSGTIIDPTDPGLPCGSTGAFFPDDRIKPSREYPEYIPNKYVAAPGHKRLAEQVRDANSGQMAILRRLMEIARAQGEPWVPGKGCKLKETDEVVELLARLEQSKNEIDRVTALCKAAKPYAG